MWFYLECNPKEKPRLKKNPGEKGNATFHVMGLQNHFLRHWEPYLLRRHHERKDPWIEWSPCWCQRPRRHTLRRPPKHGVLSHQEPANVLSHVITKKWEITNQQFCHFYITKKYEEILWTKMGEFMFKSPIASQIWRIPQWSQRGPEMSSPTETADFGSPHCRTRCPFRWSNQDEALEWCCCIWMAAKKIGKYNPIQTNWQMMVHESTVNDFYMVLATIS